MTEMKGSSSHLTWVHTPELREPCLVAGFQGWSDAGSVSSDTLQYLKESLKPDLVATLSDEGFINYSVDRPMARVKDGHIEEMDPMMGEFRAWNNRQGGNDLLIFMGKEPHLNWSLYSDTILEVMRRLGAGRLYTVGGVQDTISHTSPALVTVVGSSPSLICDTVKIEAGLRPAQYVGPVSIHSYLIKACAATGIQAASLWGHVPAYLQRSPRLVAKMISILNEAVGMVCPVDPLEQKSIELDRKIDEALGRDPNLKQFVETIEDKEGLEAESLIDEKVIRLNRFLRREKKEPEA